MTTRREFLKIFTQALASQSMVDMTLACDALKAVAGFSSPSMVLTKLDTAIIVWLECINDKDSALYDYSKIPGYVNLGLIQQSRVFSMLSTSGHTMLELESEIRQLKPNSMEISAS